MKKFLSFALLAVALCGCGKRALAQVGLFVEGGAPVAVADDIETPVEDVEEDVVDVAEEPVAAAVDVAEAPVQAAADVAAVPGEVVADILGGL